MPQHRITLEEAISGLLQVPDNFFNSLQPRTLAEQNAYLENSRARFEQELPGLVGQLIPFVSAAAIGIPFLLAGPVGWVIAAGLGAVGGTVATLAAIRHFENVRPYNWIRMETTNNVNNPRQRPIIGRIAVQDNNNGQTIDYINRVGEFFSENEQNRRSIKYKYNSKGQFEEFVKSQQDIDHFVNSIIDQISIIDEEIALDRNDIRIILAEVIRNIADNLRHGNQPVGNIAKTIDSPVIFDGQHGFGWLKYSFQSKMTVKGCCSSQKKVAFTYDIIFFRFDDKQELERAIREAQRQRF